MKHNTFIILWILGSAVLLSGCGGKNIPLSGKVTFSDDGSPLTKGIVYFETPVFRAQGEIKPNGTYNVISTSVSKGLPPGEYKVYIGGAVDVEMKMINSIPMPVNTSLIAPKLANPVTSELSVVVDRKTRKYDIIVDRP